MELTFNEARTRAISGRKMRMLKGPGTWRANTQLSAKDFRDLRATYTETVLSKMIFVEVTDDLDAILKQSLENGRAFMREQSAPQLDDRPLYSTRQEMKAFAIQHPGSVVTYARDNASRYVAIAVHGHSFVCEASTWQQAWERAQLACYRAEHAPAVHAVEMKCTPPQTVWVSLEEAGKLVNHLQHQIYLLARGCEKDPTLPLTSVGDPKIHVLIKELHKD